MTDDQRRPQSRSRAADHAYGGADEIDDWRALRIEVLLLLLAAVCIFGLAT